MEKSRFNLNRLELEIDAIAPTFIAHYSNDETQDTINIIHHNGVAYARMWWYHDEDHMRIGLGSLNVSEHMRGQGIGTLLQQIRENIGIAIGAESSFLWVVKDTWQQAWYERRGYKPLSQYEKRDDAIWMTKELVS